MIINFLKEEILSLQLGGMGIKPNHAQIKNDNGKIRIEPADVEFFFYLKKFKFFKN